MASSRWTPNRRVDASSAGSDPGTFSLATKAVSKICDLRIRPFGYGADGNDPRRA